MLNSLSLGDFELTIFSDGTYPIDGGAFFGVVPKVMWSKRLVPDERNFITAGLNSLLIRTGDRNVLVETGMGNKPSERMIKVHGQPAQLLDKMAAAGVSPKTSTSSSTRICTSTIAAGTRFGKATKSSRRFPKRRTTLPRASGSTGDCNWSGTP
jgi:hypothetical protein